MLNINDLWIGDKVTVLDGNKIGIFEGIEKGQAKIKIDNKMHLFTSDKLAVYTEAVNQMPIITFENEVNFDAPKKTKTSQKKFVYEIDLHMEKLNPSFTATTAQTVLDYQLQACEDFIRESISNKLTRCTIIHGKGEGKLRELVHSMLGSYREANMKILTNRDGATEVWFSYV